VVNTVSSVGLNEYDDRSFGRLRNLYLRQINLSTANNALELNHAGNLIFCDKDTDGDAYLSFSSNDNPLFPVGANSFVKGLPFKKLYLTNAAQAGKKLNLWYGQDVDIQPPNQDIRNIDNVSLIDKILPNTLAAHWAALVSTNLITIVAPSSNVNGIRIDSVVAIGNATGVGHILSKSSAPTSYWDFTARYIASMQYVVGAYQDINTCQFPAVLPAGEGLYAFASSANFGEFSVEYEILT